MRACPQSAYHPTPAALDHSLGFAHLSHAIKSLSDSKASMRTVATTANCSAVLRASASEVLSASLNMVSIGAVTTIMWRMSLTAFSAVVRRGSTMPGLTASTASIQGHKVVASRWGRPDVSRALGIDLGREFSGRYADWVTVSCGADATCNSMTLQGLRPTGSSGQLTNGFVIQAKAQARQDRASAPIREWREAA